MPKNPTLVSRRTKTPVPASPTLAPLEQVPTETRGKESQGIEAKTTFSRVPAQEPRFFLSKDSVSVYANHIFYAPSTMWDMRIVFGEVRGIENNKLVVENRASVTLPLAVAKLLAAGIEANLQQYQKATGKTIDLPEGVLVETGQKPLVETLTSQEPTERK